MEMCVHTHVCMCVNHSSPVVPQQEAKNTRYKLKSKTLHNGIFSFDTSNDTPPSMIRITNSQFLN